MTDSSVIAARTRHITEASPRPTASQGASRVRRTTAAATKVLASAPPPTSALRTPGPPEPRSSSSKASTTRSTSRKPMIALRAVTTPRIPMVQGRARIVAKAPDSTGPGRQAPSSPVAGGPLGAPIMVSTAASAARPAQPARPAGGPPRARSAAAVRGPASALAPSAWDTQRFPRVSSSGGPDQRGQEHGAGRVAGCSGPPGPRPPGGPRAPRGASAAAAQAATPYPIAWTDRPTTRRRWAGTNPARAAAIGAPTSWGARMASDARPVARAPPSSKA